jgi:hypothetical protein
MTRRAVPEAISSVFRFFFFFRFLLCKFFPHLFRELDFLLEFFHFSSRIHETVFSGIEGVALVAHFDRDVVARGAGRESVPAGANDLGTGIELRMDFGFHS